VEIDLAQFDIVDTRAKVYINGFPKSGTHMGYLTVAHITQPQKPKHTLGTFQDNAWTNRWANIPLSVEILKGQPEGTWVLGHMGYRDEFRKAMEEAGTCMIFVYRDLRDVAVSQAYHIEDDRKNGKDMDVLAHPDKELFMSLPSHEARIKAVIEGYDKYPGIIERWEMYAPWLDVDWVQPVRYEDMRMYPREVAEMVLGYVIRRTAHHNGYEPIVVKENWDEAVDYSTKLLQTTEYSATYRKGEVGGWKEEFTPALRKIFNKHDNGWLEKLGYKPPAVQVEANLGTLGAVPQSIGG